MGKESFSASAGGSQEVQPSKPLGVGSSLTGAEPAAAAHDMAGGPCGETGAKTKLQELGCVTWDPSLSPTPRQGAGNGGCVADPLHFLCLFF